MDEVSLLERLRAGVRVADVSQSGAELYDIDDAETAMSEAAAAIERLLAEAARNLEDADSYKASMKQYFETSISEHNAKVTAEAQRDKLKEALREAYALLLAPAEDIKDGVLSRARQALQDTPS